MTTTDYLDVCAIDGRVFSITGEVVVPTLGGLYSFLGRISETRTCLVNFFLRSDQGPLSVKIIEAPTISAAGTPTSAINRNRNSGNISDTLVYIEPTYTGGQVIYSNFVHEVGGGAHEQGGEAQMPGITVLKDNTDYVFELGNTGASDTNVSFSILWCEEE